MAPLLTLTACLHDCLWLQMLGAGGIPLLKGLTQFPNFKVRELAKDIIDALEETQTWMED